ncbi:hypothetical protein [Bradyrhizobium algeriense]|uniref:hypothetical protein n=1 Tax=Bradyrhizobium algeriense TaxID=634784 RepID=UPI002FEF46C7
MAPFLNSVEIQAHAPAITAMTIKENAIDPRSSPTFPCHVFYLVGNTAILVIVLAFRTSKLSHPHFNQNG